MTYLACLGSVTCGMYCCLIIHLYNIFYNIVDSYLFIFITEVHKGTELHSSMYVYFIGLYFLVEEKMG